MKRFTIAAVLITSALFAVGMAAGDKPATAAQAVAQPSAPKFTEVQELRLRLSLSQEQAANQQVALLQVQIKQLTEEREKLLAAVEASHPGWLVDRETFKFVAVAAKK